MNTKPEVKHLKHIHDTIKKEQKFKSWLQHVLVILGKPPTNWTFELMLMPFSFEYNLIFHTYITDIYHIFQPLGNFRNLATTWCRGLLPFHNW